MLFELSNLAFAFKFLVDQLENFDLRKIGIEHCEVDGELHLV